MNSTFKNFVAFLSVIYFCTIVVAQDNNYILNGQILNSSNEPVSEVTVRIPGGASPVYTDQHGMFKLEVKKGEMNWLVVSPLDRYSEKFQLLADQDSIVIYLTPLDIDSKFDDVSLPTREFKRRDLIGSFGTMDVSKLEQLPYSNIDQYLQGKVSGAFITSNSGMPGTGASVFIRGYSSFLTNNQPLYVVDGIPLEDGFIYNELIEGYNYNPLSAIDPQGISEITILKDAAATALYGMRGANGVILIKTLEPTETMTTIDLTLRTGITQQPNISQQLNAGQFRNLANEILFSSGMHEEVYQKEYPGLFYDSNRFESIIYNHDTQWHDQVYRNAMMQNMKFTIKGGDAIARYGLSIGYQNSEGVFRNTSMERFNIRLVGAFDIFSWLRMNINSSLTTNTSFVKESGLFDATSPLMSALFKSPMLNPYAYDTEGNLLQTIDGVKEFGVSNPTAIGELLDGRVKNYRFLTALSLDGDITENITFRSVLGLNSNDLKEFIFYPNQGFGSFYNQEAYNVSKAQNISFMGLYNDSYITYSMPRFSSLHQFAVNLGMRWQTNRYEEDHAIGKNSASDYYRYLQRGNPLLREIGGQNKHWNWGAVYTNAFYSYKDRYLATATISADISSRIGSEALGTIRAGNTPIGRFYSLGAAWRVSEEGFLRNAYYLEELKLRTSIGISGNDDVGEINAINHYTINHYRSTSVLVPGGVANRELTYQSKQQLNVGIDVSLLANRFSFSADYFENHSNDILLFMNEFGSLGFNDYPSNLASVRTSGVELNVFSRIVESTNFNIDFGANFSKYTSIVDKVPGGQYIHRGEGNVEIIFREGEQINNFYGYRFLGVFSTSEQANEANIFSDRGVPFRAGDAIFENLPDENGEYDNVIDGNDKQLLGSFEPDFFGGFSLGARYKNLSFNFFFQGVYGNKVFNYVRYQNERMTDLSNQSVKVLQRWQYEGQQTSVPKAMWNDPVGNNAFSDRWIEDGSYLRLKNLTVAYDINQSFLPINNMNVFLTAVNLFTLTKYKGYDPEFSYSPDLRHQGIDYGNMPLTRQFVVGVNIGL